VVLLSTAAVVVTAATVPAATAEPAESLEGVAFRLDRLYRQAEKAAEQYNAAQERTDRLQRGLEVLRDESARGQQTVNRMRDGLAVLAGAQYRAGAVDPTFALMLSSEPDEYLNKASTLDRISSRQATRLDELREVRRVLAQRRLGAERKLRELDQERAALKAGKRAVQQKLAAARRLVVSLPQRQRARLAARLDQRASPAGRALALEFPGAPAGADAIGTRASAAVTAAREAIGRPYVWGSAGPSAFDCSGLMVWAYRQAGVALPRTSQGQAYAGRRVPLSQAEPGDLVIYRGDASHVGMYVGNGHVVHAPYPGALVRYDPVDMLPVSAVTRPA
jgi:peptidoglycan DL-endopeptidase CwlO